MATFGTVSSESTIPNSGFIQRGNASTAENEMWTSLTMPSPGGWVTKIHVYYDVWQNGPTNATWMVLWVNGLVAAQASGINVPNGSISAGGQAWHNNTFSTPVYVFGGSSIAIGFWSPQPDGCITSSLSGGSSSMKVQTSPNQPDQINTGGVSTGIGNMGVFCEYTPNLIKIRRSGAWQEAPLQIRRSGIWVPATPLFIRRSGAWVQVA